MVPYLIPICSLSNRSLLPSLTVLPFFLCLNCWYLFSPIYFTFRCLQLPRKTMYVLKVLVWEAITILNKSCFPCELKIRKFMTYLCRKNWPVLNHEVVKRKGEGKWFPRTLSFSLKFALELCMRSNISNGDQSFLKSI